MKPPEKTEKNMHLKAPLEMSCEDHTVRLEAPVTAQILNDLVWTEKEPTLPEPKVCFFLLVLKFQVRSIFSFSSF